MSAVAGVALRGAPVWRPLLVAVVNLLLALVVGGATAIHPLVGLGLVAAAGAAIVVFIRPEAATLLVLAILYSNAAAIAVQHHGVPWVLGAAFPLLLLLPLVHHLVVLREPLVVTPALKLVLALFAVQLLGTLVSRDPATSARALATFALEGVVLFTLVTNVVRDANTLRLATWVLLLVGGAIGWLSLVQQVTGTFDQEYLGFAQVSNALLERSVVGDIVQPRLAGPIGEKNRYAQVLIVLLPLAIVRFWDERSVALRIVAALAATGILAGIALTFSRGAALGFALMLVVMVVLRYVSLRQLLALVLAAVVLLAAFPTYTARLLTLDSLTGAVASAGAPNAADDSIRSRATEGIAAFLVFADHPILGTGPGLFPSYYRRYADEVSIKVEYADREAHNLYLGEAAEGGIVGLALFLGIVGVVLRDLARARRRWRQARPDLANTAVGFTLAIVTYLTTGLFLHLAFERYFWLLMALAASAAWIALREDQVPAAPAWARHAGPAGRHVRADGRAPATGRA